MRRFLILATILTLVLTVPVWAQRVTTFEQITVGATAIGITAAIRAGMSGCSMRLETAEIRWRIDAAPTAAVGTLLEIGEVLTVERAEDLITIKFIRTGSSALLNVWCWPAP